MQAVSARECHHESIRPACDRLGKKETSMIRACQAKTEQEFPQNSSALPAQGQLQLLAGGVASPAD
jgi:hypothetical protein